LGEFSSVEGSTRESLNSIYSLFDTTRAILRSYGPSVARPGVGRGLSLGYLAVSMLNLVLRPLLTKWHLPLMALLYDRNERGDPAVWTEELELRARVVKRTRGLGSPRSRLLCGDRGGIPAWDRLLPPCSLAEMAALTGAAEYTEEGDLTAIARLVYWKGSRPR
jgi:hypothetical protein